MKLVVPLMMPASHCMRLAVRPSRMALMMGIPPATAASNATMTPFAWAAAKISLPCLANKALLAVTTRSEEHTSEIHSLMRTSYDVFCLETTIYTHSQCSIPHKHTQETPQAH